MKKNLLCLGALAFSTYAAAEMTAIKEGLVEHYGAQQTIFATGKAEGKVPLAAMSGSNAAYGLGAFAGLDGEITVYEGKPYITQVRGTSYTMDNSPNGSAIFAAWTKNTHWQDEAIPSTVKTYLDLQRYVKERASALGVDTSQPFPFLLTGTPAEVKWHINVDRTEGKPIDKTLFAKSKTSYVLQNEAVDIVGFHSELHPGVFISAYAPAIKEQNIKNSIHFHMVTKDRRAAGHVDDITMNGGMTLRLPKN